MRVAVLVPRRGDSGWRDHLWEFCRAWWLERHPDWPIYEGASPAGPFQRSAACNDAARQAGAWDVGIVLDTDVILNPEAVTEAVALSADTGRMVLPHNERVDLSRWGTQRVLDGERGPWRTPKMVAHVWTPSDSSCVVVPRALWGEVGGFDERFVGWGYEDTAFRIACERAAGPAIVLEQEVFHLWHERPPEGPDSPERARNLALLNEVRTDGDPLIPAIIHRTCPVETTREVEKWWKQRQKMYGKGWEFRTYRDPIDPKLFPRTSPLWDRCETGAQKADLIRLEALVQWGGIYVDTDCRPIRPMDSLRTCGAFAAWEDETTIPNAVMGATANHPAMSEALDRAIAGVERGWDTYRSGVAITTDVFKDRADMVVLPPGAFYPHHYLAKNEASLNVGPWTFEEHCWHHSWGTDESRRSIAERQR